MSARSRWCSMRSFKQLLQCCAFMGLQPAALAGDVLITAKYTPSSDSNRFTNTTPLSGYCVTHFAECGGEKFSVSLPITYTKSALIGNGPPVDRWGVVIPAERNVTVVSDSGNVEAVSFAFTYISQSVFNDASTWGNNQAPYGTSWQTGGGCTFANGWMADSYRDNDALWAVKTPGELTYCYEIDDYRRDPTVFQEGQAHAFSVGYRLTTPNPLRMKAGIYRGSTTFTVGEYGDIGLGPRVSELNAASVTLDFELEVQHALALEFPANSDRLILEPPGSWSTWLGGGPAPAKLVREVPFRITNSGPLEIYMTCEHELAGSCAIANERNGEQAPLNVLLTLPDLITESGLPVRRRAIPVGEGAALELDVVTPAVNQPASLMFETARGATAEMVKNAGDRYVGAVTVVFDAAL